ncbi:MAG TPA: FHA domain-containing protein [Kofleriaceae bacterium]|jgi:hypothetical protein|nr:FHA domain-containing protein [Kofleriaceae bacterium]
MLGAPEPPVDLELTDPTSSAAPAPTGRLRVVFPRALDAAFAIADRPFVLGRQGDGKLLHPTVSRAHALVTWSAEAGAHLVRDLDSRNGSVLDGVPLSRQARPLRDGSVLRLGSVVAVWDSGTAADAQAAGALDITLDGTRDIPVDLSPRGRPPVPSRDAFVAAFDRLGGSVRALARHFARDRRQIYRWIAAHGLADRR